MAKKRNPLGIWGMYIEMAVLVLVTVWLTCAIWSTVTAWIPDVPKETEPPTTTVPEETPPPTTTEPPFTIPETASGAQAVSLFAAEYGLDVTAYTEKLIETYDKCPEARDFVLNYPLEYGKERTVDMSEFENTEGVPLFMQWDPRWGYTDYAGTVGGVSGCAPTCLAMVNYYWTGDAEKHPGWMMNFATENKYVSPTGGSQWTLISEGAVELGFEVKEIALVKQWVVNRLKDGIPIIVTVREGLFTTAGHFIVLVGYENGQFQVNDPNSVANSTRTYTWEELSGNNQIKNMWAVYPAEAVSEE